MFWWQSKRIKNYHAQLEKINSGDYKVRLPIQKYDDLGKLIETFNNTLDVLSVKIDGFRQESVSMQAILDNMVEGVIAVDKDARVLTVNPAAKKLFAVEQDKAVGRFFLETFQNSEIADIVNTCLSTGTFISREAFLLWPSQKTFQINASPSIMNSKVSGCVCVIHDITEIRKLETMRQDFVANVSHELKTPLTSIKGFVETLLEGALDDKENSRHFLEIIYKHTERLDNLIHDLLDLASIESKDKPLNKIKFDLKELIEEVVLGFKSQIKSKRISVELVFSAHIPIFADKDRIEQVITNYIDNAIKFNKEGGVLRIYSSEEPGIVKIVVEDSGLGISQKDLSRIFERFYRVDKARSREMGGTGLGLSIVKHIIELHGGSVGVSSTEGGGSSFWFSLSKSL